MAPTEAQRAAIDRLRENESLTGNLTDTVAKVVLAFAEQQILAGLSYDQVVAAVKTANKSSATLAQDALAIAQQALTQPAATPAPPLSFWKRVKRFFTGG